VSISFLLYRMHSIVCNRLRSCRFIQQSATKMHVTGSSFYQPPYCTIDRQLSNARIDREVANLLQTCGGHVSDTANKSASPQQVVVMEFEERHNGLLPAPTCYGLVVYVADLLWTCYEEVASLLRTCYGETKVMVL